MNPFGDGSQGALNVTSGITYLPLNTKLQYTTVNVGASGTIRPSGTTGSVLYICATESITINGTINVRDIVNYGNNTWGVTIDGQSFTSPGVANGGNGRYYTGNTQALQSAGFGGGGGGSGATFSGTYYRGGIGGNGSTSPSGGTAISVSRSSDGTSANRRDAAGTNGGSGVAVAYRSGTNYTGTTSATGGSGGQGYGGNGAAGSGSHSHTGGSGSPYWYSGGGGGAGGRAGRAGVHVVLKSPTVIINGTINTSGTNGTNGGNGGRARYWDGWRDIWGLPGGGGGGGNAGEIQVTYNTTFTDSGTYLQTGGSGGSGGIGGTNNATVGYDGAGGLSNGLASTRITPIVDFTANVTSGGRPLTVNFTNKSSGSSTYLWDFGDGTTSTQVNPTKVYSTVGTFTVSLKATNGAGEVTETKTGFITTTINDFSRTAGGMFLLGGNTNRRLIASRTAGGTFLLGGTTRAVLIRDAEAVQDKTYLYKVYDPDGNFIEVWKDVADEPQFTHEINSIGSSMTVELARNSDTVGTTTSPILDDNGQAILDDTELPILGSMETRNQIGAGTSVDYNNRVDIVAFYGSSEPLYDDEMDEILDDNGEAIITEVGAPNGRRIFTGFISEINSRYGNTESTVVQLTSYGFDLDQYPITTSDGKTTVPFLSKDPSQIARDAVDKFVSDSMVLGTTNHSTNPSFETGSGTVEVRRNYVLNPSAAVNTTNYFTRGSTGFSGTVSRLTGQSPIPGVTTATRSTLNSLTGSWWQLEHRNIAPPSGQVAVSFRARSSYSGDLSLHVYCTGGSSTIDEQYDKAFAESDTWVTKSAVVTVPPATTEMRVAIRSSTPGTAGSTLDMSCLLVEAINAVLPYFDGSTNDGFDTASLTPAWTGTADNSASVLNGVVPTSALSRYGSGWAGSVWQSKESPAHGASFARMLIKSVGSSGNGIFEITDTSGTSSGEQLTFVTNVRSSRGMNVVRQYYGSSGWVANDGTQALASGEWTSVRRTVTSVTSNQRAAFATSIGQVQPGDIIDIDNHMVVKGSYTGDYFDGNSQNAVWTGSPNASTSSLLKSQTYTKRTSDSIATTGTQVSYTFRNNTYKEVLDKVLELMPSDWYYRVGLGDNTVYFRERSNTPQHLFYLGKHIKSLDLKGSIMDVTNHVLFTGGGDPALYIEEKQAPAARTRRGLEIISDSRVTLDTSARIIAQGKIDAGNKMQNRSTIEILAKQYNIEEIQVGHVVGFRNFGNDIDGLELIVAGLSYSPDVVQLALERKPPTVNKRLQDVVRNLNVQENNNTPAAPS